MFRKFVVGLVVGLMVLLVGQFALAGEIIEIDFWESQQPIDRVMKNVIEPFEAEYPNIKINLVFVGPGQMHDTVSTALAAGMPPNVLLGYSGRLAKWAWEGFLIDHKWTLTQTEIDNFLPGVVDTFSIEGKLFCYPCYFVPVVFTANKTLLERIGVWDLVPQSIEEDWTISDFMMIAEKVKEYNPDIYSAFFHANGRGGDVYMLDYFKGFGANHYASGDLTDVTLNSEAGIEALEWMGEMVDRGYAPKGVAAFKSSDIAKMRNAGLVVFSSGAMSPVLPHVAREMYDTKASPELWEWKWIRQPHLAGIDSPGIFISPGVISVFQTEDSQKLAASILFAKWVNNNTMKWFTEQSGNIPLQKSVEPKHLIKNEDYARLSDYLAEYGITDAGIHSPHYTQIRNLRFPELQAYFMGKKTAKEALDDFAKAAEDLWK